jgi:hypothetical protein
MKMDTVPHIALSKLSTGVVWDTLRVMGLPHQALHHSIKGLETSMTLCGPAFCVKGQTWFGTPPKPATNKPQPRYELFEHLYDGCIMLIDSGGYEEAVLMGENFAISAVGAGCKGFVLDGALRDATSMVEQKIPVFNRFLTPASSAGSWSIVGYEVPIQLKGQTHATVNVMPGDWILADRDGVVVIPGRHVDKVAEYAARVEEVEIETRKLMVAGLQDRKTIYEKFDRFSHVKHIDQL